MTLLRVTTICTDTNAENCTPKSCNEMGSEPPRLNPGERCEPVVLRSGFPHQAQVTTHHPARLTVGRFVVPAAREGG